ncbi:MAG: nucleotidyltransferase domain-containing protein [Candidatus Aenigmatarchaeota archaeon]
MLEKIKKILEKERKIIFAYLFGSFLKYPKYSQDLDIGIFVKGKVKLNYELELALKIEKVVNKSVDVIILNDKPLIVVSEVLRNGKLIFSKDDKLRVKFETSMLRDILYFNELMKEYDKKRFERYGIR